MGNRGQLACRPCESSHVVSKIMGRIAEPAHEKRGQKVLLVLGEQARQFARVARGQNWQLFSLVLGEKVRTVATGKNPDRLICPDRQGQGCRNGRTVFLQRRHILSEHSTPREIYNAAPRAPAVRGLPCRSAAARRKDNAAAPKRAPCRACARPRFALLFRLERTKRRAPYLSRLSFRQAFRIFQSVPLFGCLALLNLFGRTF